MLLFEALAQILSRLKEQGARTALLGGWRFLHGLSPALHVMSISVAVQTDSDAERLLHGLLQRGYRLLATVEQTAAGRLATARLLPPDETQEGMIVDLLFASSGIEPEIVDAAPEIDIGASTPVHVARVGHLVSLKLLAHDPIERPQDAVDLHALRVVLDEREEQRARESCELIMQRGYHRGRDLPALLDAYLAAKDMRQGRG
jgi:hypothetical protein